MRENAAEQVRESLDAINRTESAGVKAGPFEIRPAADLTGMIGESEQRRSGAKAKSK